MAGTATTADPRIEPGLGRFLAVMAAANLGWEVLQLPLYTVWSTASPPMIAWAVIHCTAGDMLIGAAAFVIGRRLTRGLPRTAFVAALVTLGVANTVFSEWLNVPVRGSRAYAPAMPVMPPFGTGLPPLLQWLVLPPAVFFLAGAFTKIRA